jgi:hypothetical protein
MRLGGPQRQSEHGGEEKYACPYKEYNTSDIIKFTTNPVNKYKL